MIKNILAFVFSAVLIDFDRKFIDSQGYLYAPDSTITACLNIPYNSNSNYTDSNNGNIDYTGISLSLAKGELAASVIILVSSLVFVGIYIYVYIRALNDNRNMHNNGSPFGDQRTAAPSKYQTEATQLDVTKINVNDQAGLIVCHKCGAALKISERTSRVDSNYF
jgi:hypothetical protein